jgi:hypothetical protein
MYRIAGGIGVSSGMQNAATEAEIKNRITPLNRRASAARSRGPRKGALCIVEGECRGADRTPRADKLP